MEQIVETRPNSILIEKLENLKANTEDLLLIFTRNPELGRCKTRLAAAVGDKTALEIYKFLLEHTVEITAQLGVHKEVHYSEEIWENDIWDNDTYSKKLQTGIDLGERMANAFKAGFNAGYKKIIIIGSDMYDLNQVDLEGAFETLEKTDFVVGPAMDGGYYLLGMKTYTQALFSNKSWGSDSVLKDTLKNLEDERFELLEERNDVDYYEDIKDIEAFQALLKNEFND